MAISSPIHYKDGPKIEHSRHASTLSTQSKQSKAKL